MNNPSPTAPLNFLNHKTGLWSWLSSTDHKRIGLLYLYAITTFFLSAAVLGLLMKIEKVAPGETIMTAQTYNAMFTLHGIIMIFIVVIPGLAAVFGNIMLPIMIGAKDVAFPKLNLFSFYVYILPVRALVSIPSLRMAIHPIRAGHFMFHTVLKPLRMW